MDIYENEWRLRAKCRGADPDLFFPEKGDVEGVAAAKAVCSTCPVTEHCITYADLFGEKLGIWGGESSRMRRIRRSARREEGPDLEAGTLVLKSYTVD